MGGPLPSAGSPSCQVEALLRVFLHSCGTVFGTAQPEDGNQATPEVHRMLADAKDSTTDQSGAVG